MNLQDIKTEPPDNTMCDVNSLTHPKGTKLHTAGGLYIYLYNNIIHKSHITSQFHITSPVTSQ